jgi:signal transduction histidine kinase
VNLNTVIEELLLLVRHKLKNQGIKFDLHLEPALPEVPGDAAQLSQALLNLVLNAIEAMPDGGVLDGGTSAREGSPRHSSRCDSSSRPIA